MNARGLAEASNSEFGSTTWYKTSQHALRTLRRPSLALRRPHGGCCLPFPFSSRPALSTSIELSRLPRCDCDLLPLSLSSPSPGPPAPLPLACAPLPSPLPLPEPEPDADGGGSSSGTTPASRLLFSITISFNHPFSRRNSAASRSSSSTRPDKSEIVRSRFSVHCFFLIRNRAIGIRVAVSELRCDVRAVAKHGRDAKDNQRREPDHK